VTARPEVDLGVLSGAETAFGPEARAQGTDLDAMLEQHAEMSRRNARPHYEKMLATTRAAAQELAHTLEAGLPALIQLPNGGYDGIACARQVSCAARSGPTPGHRWRCGARRK
jgi:hypothetical protein